MRCGVCCAAGWRAIAAALNKEDAQRPRANNGGRRRNGNRPRISVGSADWLCNVKRVVLDAEVSCSTMDLPKPDLMKIDFVKRECTV